MTTQNNLSSDIVRITVVTGGVVIGFKNDTDRDRTLVVAETWPNFHEFFQNNNVKDRLKLDSVGESHVNFAFQSNR